LHAVELARAQRELTSQTELLRRAEANGAILEEENTTLRKQSTEVRYEQKNVDVVPPGFTSIQEAIETKQGELDALVVREETTIANIAALEEECRAAAEKLAQFNANVDDFLAMKTQVEQIIAKFPLSTLKEMAVGDKNINAALGALGQTMKLFGAQLNSAVA
jgi:cell division protein FtsB